MLFRYNNIWCYVEGDGSEIGLITPHLTYMARGARYTEAYKKKRWDGKKSLFNSRYNSFPTGLMQYVVKKARIEPRYEDIRPECRIPANRKIKLRDGKELRYYQQEAIDSFLSAERGIISAPTRSGKGLIAASITRSMGLNTIFIVNSKDLLSNIPDEFEIAGIQVGKVGDGKKELREVVIATVQTLSRALRRQDKKILDFLKSRELVFFDEVHNASQMIQDTSRIMTQARYRLGLSATPLMGGKENSLLSQSICGPMIYQIDESVLIDDGFLAKTKCYFIENPYSSSKSYSEWDELQDEDIIFSDHRNKLIAKATRIMSERGKKILILVEALPHGDEIKYFLDQHLRVAYISGEDKQSTRDHYKQLLIDGDIDILIATRIYNQGVNIPELDCLIIAGGWKSPVVTLQRLGRPITATEEKSEAIVIDFYDSGNRLLKSHSRQRMEAIEKKKAFEVERITIDML